MSWLAWALGGLEPKFPLGRLVWTAGVNAEMADNLTFCKYVLKSLRRHTQCDWGDLDEHDVAENEFALDKDLRLFSAYEYGDDVKIWIITEADRSVTTVLFPSEY